MTLFIVYTIFPNFFFHFLNTVAVSGFSSSAHCLKPKWSAQMGQGFVRNKDNMPPNWSLKLAWCNCGAWGYEFITFFPYKHAALPVPVFAYYNHRPHRCSHDDEDVSVWLMELFIVVELLPQLPKDLGAWEGNVCHFLWKDKKIQFNKCNSVPTPTQRSTTTNDSQQQRGTIMHKAGMSHCVQNTIVMWNGSGDDSKLLEQGGTMLHFSRQPLKIIASLA